MRSSSLNTTAARCRPGIASSCVFTSENPQNMPQFEDNELLTQDTSSTVSFLISIVGFGLQATWASWQVLNEADAEPAVDRGDGVRHMALRADGERLLAGNLGVAQVPRSGRG